MDIEEKKRILGSYLSSLRREQEIQAEIDRIRTDKMFPSVVNDGMPRGSHIGDLSDYASILFQQLEMLEREQERREKKRMQILEAIGRLADDEQQSVLYMRYIQGSSLEAISRYLGKKDRRIRQIQRKAIDALEM